MFGHQGLLTAELGPTYGRSTVLYVAESSGLDLSASLVRRCRGAASCVKDRPTAMFHFQTNLLLVR
jgi:hypothetical protein